MPLSVPRRSFDERVVVRDSRFLRSLGNAVDVAPEGDDRFSRAPARHPGGGDAGDSLFDFEPVLSQKGHEIARGLDFLKSQLAEAEDLVDHDLGELRHLAHLGGCGVLELVFLIWSLSGRGESREPERHEDCERSRDHRFLLMRGGILYNCLTRIASFANLSDGKTDHRGTEAQRTERIPFATLCVSVTLWPIFLFVTGSKAALRLHVWMGEPEQALEENRPSGERGNDASTEPGESREREDDLGRSPTPPHGAAVSFLVGREPSFFQRPGE